MASNTTTPGGMVTSTKPGGMSGPVDINTVIITTATLGGAVIVLAVILLCLYCRRNRVKQDINPSVKSVNSPAIFIGSRRGAEDNAAFTVTDETSTPRRPRKPEAAPRVGSNRESAASYVDVSGGAHQTESMNLNRSGQSPLDITTRVPVQRDNQASLPDYINTSAEVYENVNGVPPKPPPMNRNSLVPPELPSRRGSTESTESINGENNLFRRGTKAYHLYTNAVQDYEMSRDELQMEEKLGKGHFGYVYAGKARKLPHTSKQNQQVAIKTMRGSATDSDKQEFLYEYEIMKLTNTLKHRNITKLLGSVTNSQPCFIVLELMTNGNLRTFLRETRSQDVYYNLHGNSSCLSERQLLQFAVDIANGMEGISDLQLLHRDLAARNILLDENLTCKIADFGFAKDVLNKPQYKSKSVFQRPRPTRWLAPESLLLFNHSILSDVWSYGIVLWEIITLGNLPYPNMKKPAQVAHAISQGYRMPCPMHCSSDIYKVMTCCWEEKPIKRPAFPQLVDRMKQLLDQATYMLDMGRLEENDDYIEILPPDEHEIHTNYESQETLA